MKRSPIAATLVVLGMIVGVPVMLFSRLSDGVLPTQSFDAILLIAVLAWICVSKALIERDSALTSTVENRISPIWQAHSLIEQSVFGVGFLSKKRTPEMATIHGGQLWSPDTSIENLLPPVQQVVPIRRELPVQQSEDDRPVRSQPTLRHEEPEFPPIIATEEYVAGRGDTFWSIAEARLGQGRRWKQIEEINIGRQVSGDHQFSAGDALRSGWSILVPLFSESTDGDE